MNEPSLLLLLIYSGFTINLVLQCALGLRGVIESKTSFNITTLIKSSLIFFLVIVLWFLFSRLLFSVISGIFIYILLFPVSAVFYDGLEFLIFRHVLKIDSKSESIISFPGGLTAVAAFVCINIADNFAEAAVLSFGFVFGIFFVNLFINEIRRRAAFEAVPLFLRGKPMILVALGLLSLVFTAVSLMLFRVIGTG